MVAHVYLLVHDTEPRVKIGKANDPVVRAATLGHEQFDFSRSQSWAVDSEADAYQLERILHLVFRAYRLNPIPAHNGHRIPGCTEWFSVDCLEQAVNFLSSNASVFGCRRADMRSWLIKREVCVPDVSEQTAHIAQVGCVARLSRALELGARLARNDALKFAKEPLPLAWTEKESRRFKATIRIALTDFVYAAERVVLLTNSQSPYAELCARLLDCKNKSSEIADSLLRAGRLDFYNGFDEMRLGMSHLNFFHGYSSTAEPWHGDASLVVGVFWNPDFKPPNAVFKQPPDFGSHHGMVKRASNCMRAIQPRIAGWDLPLTDDDRHWAEVSGCTVGWRQREKRKKYNAR